MSTPRTATHRKILAVLDRDMTSGEIAQLSVVAWMGVESALKGMVRRGEVIRLRQRVPGETYRYRRAG